MSMTCGEKQEMHYHIKPVFITSDFSFQKPQKPPWIPTALYMYTCICNSFQLKYMYTFFIL